MDLIIAVLALVLCYLIGNTIEQNHYKDIRQREVKLYKSPCISYGKAFSRSSKIKKAFLVSSSVVVGCDHFKHFVASLKNIFGGNVSAYESVLDRGRREAILRIREQAQKMAANAVINVKIETVMLDPLDNNNNSKPKVCVTAYGTAIRYA